MGTVDLAALGLLPTGGTIGMFTKNGTDCLNTGEFVRGILDWNLTSEIKLSEILNKIK